MTPFLAKTSDYTTFSWDYNDLDGLGIRLAINLLVLFVIVRLLYYPKTRRKDYLFTYFLIGIITFFLCFGLKKLDIDTGMGLGLFAIFGIIRYRTDAIEIKEMTYLFLVIGLSVVNAMLATEVDKDIYQINLLELGVINLSVIGVLYVLEYLWLMKHETRKVINYDRVDLIKAENHEALKQDLEERTGLVINRFEIGKIDFLNDTCLIRIYYYAEDQDFSNYGG
jgi:predicted membrane channel-forming protein YqfA (hemolysin III family)